MNREQHRRNSGHTEDWPNTNPNRFVDEPPSDQATPTTRDRVYRKLGSYRAEILVEACLILLCTALGVAFQLKVMLTVSLFCIAAAIPDIVTGLLVRRQDPDPRHGKALMYFFVANGLLRTAMLGVTVFILSTLCIVIFPFALGLADVGAITGLLVTMAVFVIVFPVTLLGVLNGYSLKGGVFFCRELTRIRRKGEAHNIDPSNLNPGSSLRILATGSAVSAAVFSIATVFIGAAILNAGNRPSEFAQFLMVAIVVAQLIIPMSWYIFFCVKFADPWQTHKNASGEYVEPLSADEIQFLND